MTEIAALWTVKELADYLGYKESTLVSIVTKKPDNLPPKVSGLHLPRWNPDVVREWTIQRSRRLAPEQRRGGRPRKVV